MGFAQMVIKNLGYVIWWSLFKLKCLACCIDQT
jgi:hypothetical protein